MQVTIQASTLDWMNNGSTLWATRLDDLSGSSVVFSEGYTPTITNKLVKVTNATRPTGTLSYTGSGNGVTATVPLHGINNVADTEDCVTGALTRNIGSADFSSLEWVEGEGTWTAAVSGIKADTTNVMSSNGYEITVSGTNVTVTSTTSPTGMFYYEKDSASVSTEAAQTMVMTSGINTIGQSDGGRTADFTLNYNGLDYTVALDTTRKYAFSDNGTTSMIENASSQAVRIGEDMLVDIDQLVNGNATRKAAITSWSDLKAQYPEYASYVSYNAGQVMGVQPTVSANGYVRNQLVQNGDFSNDGTNWTQSTLNTATFSDGYCYFTSTASTNQIYQLKNRIAGHKYIAVARVKTSTATDMVAVRYSGTNCGYTTATTNWQIISGTVTPSTTADNSSIGIIDTRSSGWDTIQIDWIMLVDLTQLFGGNQARIDSIQTWDDLVAAVPAYANYVAYDTGTAVAGGGSAQASAPLYGLGTDAEPVVDIEDPIRGTRTEYIASYTFDGTESFGSSAYSDSTKSVFVITGNSYIDGLLQNVKHVEGQGFFLIGGYICNKLESVRAGSYYFTAPYQFALNTSAEGSAYIWLTLPPELTTGSQCRAWLKAQYDAGDPVVVYYLVETPVTSTVATSAMSTVNGSNTVYQTDGGRVADFDLGYKGLDYTLALDSSHKYGFKHGSTGSILTGASSQAVVAGSDMLVDVTRLVNGDSAKISAITAWSDIVAGYPEYAAYVAYNAGEVKGVTPTVKATGKNLLDVVNCGKYNSGVTPTYSTGKVTATIDRVVDSHTYVFHILDLGPASSFMGSTLTFSYTKTINGVASSNNLNSNCFVSYDTGYSNRGQIGLSGATGSVTVTNEYAGKRIGFRLYSVYGGDVARDDVVEFSNIQIELGSTATAYVAYSNRGSMTASTPLHGVGTARDTENGVDGKRTEVLTSYTFKATDSWGARTGYANTFYIDLHNGAGGNTRGCICSKYATSNATDWTHLSDYECICAKTSNNHAFHIKDPAITTTEQARQAMTGVTVYYITTDPTLTDVTPSSISMQQGTNVLTQTDGGRTADFTLDYDGTDYDIATDASRKYIKRINGTDDYITGGSPVSVRGKRDKLIDLTYMFGAGYEPATLAAFYKLFPTWRGYDIPHDKGSVLNFKGTGIVSTGFNLLNVEGRTAGTPQNTASSNTTKRGVFDESKYYVGFSGLNYYQASNVTSYSVSATQIKVTANNAAYGIGFPIRVIPGATYRIENYITSVIRIAYYTYDGQWLDQQQNQSGVAPTNAYWAMVLCVGTPANTECTWTNPCVHLQWSGTRNGDYDQYWDYVRPLPTLTYFPNGMNGIGTVADEISNKQAVQRLRMVNLADTDWTESAGTWVHQFNDIKADTPNIVATGHQAFTLSGQTVTFTSQPTGYLVYELSTPVTTVFADEVNLSYQVSDYGTESIVPVNGTTLETAPIFAVVQYQGDYARTITKLPENYQSQKSMDALLELLGQLHNGVIQSTFNAATQSYGYTFTPNE